MSVWVMSFNYYLNSTTKCGVKVFYNNHITTVVLEDLYEIFILKT